MDDFRYGYNFRAPKVDVHKFSMIPRAEIPRSRFKMQSQHKTTFNASNLIPIFVQEVLPGDSFSMRMTAFVRLATPIYPIMDNIDLESFFFFVPCRIVWQHWVNFMGEQRVGPSESISYTIPTVSSGAGGFAAGTVFDYFGVPIGGSVLGGSVVTVNALPLRCYNMIYNEWFRDENLVTAAVYGATGSVYDLGDGPDLNSNYGILTAAKRHDYFTSCLPWTQKGAAGAVTLPLAGNATVKTNATDLYAPSSATPLHLLQAGSGTPPAQNLAYGTGNSGATSVLGYGTSTVAANTQGVFPSNLYADLSTATATTINQLRLSFQTQKLLERDARGGTRYTEIVRSHFGVVSPDMRLQRPEYLGGGRQPVNMAPVPQTVPTYTGGPSTPTGTLAGVGTAVMRPHGFRQSFTEHGYIIGIVCARREQVYQQGLRRLWTRSTRYDFYFPVFAMLGEQGVRNDEIYLAGSAAGAQDATVFGYQERWAEYRYMPSYVSSAFRSSFSTPLDSWHCAINFGVLPTLANTFIADETTNVLARNLAAGALAGTNHEQFLADFFFDMDVARPMPMYSVPGLIDHF